MGNSYGENLRVTIFGQSHSPAIGVTIEGLPSGFEVNQEALAAFMARRAPGKNAYSTARREADAPEFVAGLAGGKTCGSPLTAIIRNSDTRSQDYAPLKDVPRPGHADFTARVKYGESRDYAGGGQFSGRLTAPLCIAGALCLQLLEQKGVQVISRIASIGSIKDEGELCVPTSDKDFPVVDDERGELMRACIAEARAAGDSVGGVVECAVLNLPAGLGDPMFGGMENRISSIVFGIPAVKGIEFGAGFAVADMLGSDNNDAFCVEEGRIRTLTNHSGGILGGITTGMPVRFCAAFKPTPSIAKQQQSVNMSTFQATNLCVGGRHDPCIVPRAVPCVEAAAAIAVYDAYLAQNKYWN